MMMRRWLAAAVGVALVVALGAGAVMAQSGGGSSGNTTFLDRVAQKLGIETPKLRDAITSTRNEDIDAAVQKGDLTQKQADELKQRAADAPGFGDHFGKPGRPGKGFGGHGFAPGRGMGVEQQALADFLGIPVPQLETELQASNATLATVAAAHGKSADDLKAFISTSLKTKLDAAVKNGDLTQKQADDMTSKFNAHLDDLINGTGGLHRGHGRPFGGNHAPGAAPNGAPPDGATPNTAPQSGANPGGAFGF